MSQLDFRKHFRAATAFNPHKRRWPLALKAGLAMSTLLAGSYVLGYKDVGSLVSFGTFVVLYGHDTAAGRRFRTVTGVAAAMTISATVGAVVAPIPWLWVMSLAVTAALLTFLLKTLQVGPPGAFYIVLVQGAAGSAALSGKTPTTVFITVGIGAFVAAAIGMLDLLWDPHGPQRRAVKAAVKATDEFVKALDVVVIGHLSEESPEWETLAAKRHDASMSIHHAWTTVTDGTDVLQFADELSAIERRYMRYNTRALDYVTGLRVASFKNISAETEIGVDEATLHSADPERRRQARRIATEQIRETALGRPQAVRLLMRALRPYSEERLVALRAFIGTLLAGSVALILGSSHVYWAAAFATLLLNRGGTRDSQIVRTFQRVLGTIGGLGVFAILQYLDLRGWALIIVAGLMQATVEMFMERNYGVATMFITPLALTLAEKAASGGVTEVLVLDRLLDTFIAAAFVIVTLFFVGRSRRVPMMRAYARNVVEGIEEVLVDIAGHRQTTPKGQEHRRMLYYALLQSHEVSSYAEADEPDASEGYVEMEESLSNLGYLVLAMAWHPDLRNARDLAAQCREPLDRILAHPVDGLRPAKAIHDDVRELTDIVQAWRP
ncbi:FUSC family protein [Trueperella bialowiezensis]|nr:FUSC family protein [Trueperella bialowiezensis]